MNACVVYVNKIVVLPGAREVKKKDEEGKKKRFFLLFLFSLSLSVSLSLRLDSRTDSAVADQAEAEDLLHGAALLARRALRLCRSIAAARRRTGAG
jgi:hypothetical protein